jgi:hypothetical protein
MYQNVILLLLSLVLTSCTHKPEKMFSSYPVVPVNTNRPLNCNLDLFQEVIGNIDQLKNDKNKVEIHYPLKQKNGLMKLIFIFMNDGTNRVIIKPDDFNGDNQPGIGYIIHDDEQKIVVLEASTTKGVFGFYPLFIHSFFKETGMYIYHKTNTIINNGAMTQPRGTMATGWCN